MISDNCFISISLPSFKDASFCSIKKEGDGYQFVQDIVIPLQELLECYLRCMAEYRNMFL